MTPETNLPEFLALAFWFGVLTSISPCPLTTNIAAMSFIARKMDGTTKSLLSGFLYTFGRVVAYLCLGFITVKGIVSIPGISVFLQHYANRILGILLILVGMFLLELITLDWSISAGADKLQSKVEDGGLHWSFILGFIFALSFCPPSAAIFFGSVIPLAIKGTSLILIPLVYGLGTGLPVMFFAVVIARGATTLGKYFSMVQTLERYLRQITGYIFIAGGIYLTLVYVYKVL